MAKYCKRRLENKKTKKIKEFMMWDEEYETFIKENSDWQPITVGKSFFVGDPIRQGITKTPDSFNSLLKHIKQRNRGSNIETR